MLVAVSLNFELWLSQRTNTLKSTLKILQNLPFTTKEVPYFFIKILKLYDAICVSAFVTPA